MAKFEKLKFEKIVDGLDTQYKINDKFVSSEVYESTLNDESLFTFPPLPNVNNNLENDCGNNCNTYNEEHICEDCQSILDTIEELCEMEDSDAINYFRGILETARTEASLETSIGIYNSIGNSTLKLALRMENELDDLRSQIMSEDE